MSLPVVSKLLRIIAITAYLASLVLAPHATRSGSGEYGFVLLLFGWVSVFDMKSAWLANPLVITCFALMRSYPGIALVLGSLALLAAHDFATFDSLGWDSSSDIYHGTIVGLNIGCYLWLGSLILASMASAIQWAYSQGNFMNGMPNRIKLALATAFVVLSAVPLLVVSKLYYFVDPYNRAEIACRVICADPHQREETVKLKQERATNPLAPAPSPDECDCG